MFYHAKQKKYINENTMSNILIVEDNDINYLLLEKILSDFDLTLVRAACGSEFYSIIAASKKFHLVLMDLMLPDTNGIELTKYLINNNIRIPVVFISAYSERCEEIFDLGVKYFIHKPVMPELFLSIVQRFVTLNAKYISK